jgi:phage N-6-adenine-methyltransferase
MTENPRDTWETPQWLFGWCVRKYGSFDVDAAAGHHNAKCKKFWTREDDALTQDWSGLAVFANVPFCGGNDIAAWLHKGMDAYKAIYVLPVRTDVDWWGEVIVLASEIVFIGGRVNFIPPENIKASSNFERTCIVAMDEGIEDYPRSRYIRREDMGYKRGEK